MGGSYCRRRHLVRTVRRSYQSICHYTESSRYTVIASSYSLMVPVTNSLNPTLSNKELDARLAILLPRMLRRGVPDHNTSKAVHTAFTPNVSSTRSACDNCTKCSAFDSTRCFHSSLFTSPAARSCALMFCCAGCRWSDITNTFREYRRNTFAQQATYLGVILYGLLKLPNRKGAPAIAVA